MLFSKPVRFWSYPWTLLLFSNSHGNTLSLKQPNSTYRFHFALYLFGYTIVDVGHRWPYNFCMYY